MKKILVVAFLISLLGVALNRLDSSPRTVDAANSDAVHITSTTRAVGPGVSLIAAEPMPGTHEAVMQGRHPYWWCILGWLSDRDGCFLQPKICDWLSKLLHMC